MSDKSQKVVVIQDLSRETSLERIRLVLTGLPLKPGDEITFLGILHHVINPMGYRMKADNANPVIVEEEFSRKSDEYRSNVQSMGVVRHWKETQIQVGVRVILGPSAKKNALVAAKELEATWVIIDRQMKRDKRYFMEELPKCRISRLKRNNTIEELQGMKTDVEAVTERGIAKTVTYGEMIPGTPNESPFFGMPCTGHIGSAEQSVARNVTYGDFVPGTSDNFPDSKKSSNLVHYFQPSESATPMPEVINTISGLSDSEVPASPQQLLSAEQKVISWVAGEGDEQSIRHGSSKLLPPLLDKLHSAETETLQLTTTASSSSLANTEASSSSQSDAKSSPLHNSDEAYTTNTEVEELSPVTLRESQTMMDSPDNSYLNHSDYEEFTGLYQTKDAFKNSVCSCGNRRPISSKSREFKYAELNKATEGFAPKNFLSEGGFGCVYRGRLKNGMYVAVKQHKHASSEHSRRPFHWKNRIKIASGAARGLKYLN